ncbi:copper chaperone PCu(A)C [Pararoseomonas indoligenes]|uniref:Copper chaperone PCu(A)C n=1 Tax=Roseomonas indoligenes TaxID=2820811 RepID=A0A940S570_9PROT|nr:copper chaperone PCu(A)C [Pararoseomonas indoligenes]MBP0492655.1 copper chaperone PCu(A)C [Pararoseomonas indoligenes]
MSFTRRTTIATIALSPALATAQQAPSGGVAVEQPWMRAAIQGGTGGAFLTLRNSGTQPDRLLSASSPAARAVELHSTVRQGDVMRMLPVQAVDVPAGGSVTLRPGGLHIMLVGLAEAARAGGTVPLTLNFERAGAVPVQLAVQAAGASGPAGQGHQH